MNGHPGFDESVFDLLKSELGVEDTAAVLKIFLADSARKIETCAASMQDRALVKREAHAIKSSAATFGFVELSRQARNIERDVGGMGAPEIGEAIAALEEIFRRTHDFARSVLLAGDVENV